MLRFQKYNNGFSSWVVFIHGIAGSTKTWKKQVASFNEKYNLLLIDLPGHGENAEREVTEVNEDLLNDSIREVLDYNGIISANFVGLSLGTLVVASFAIAYPSYVQSITYGGAVLNMHGIYKGCMRIANGLKKVIPYKPMYHFLAWFMLPKKNHLLSRQIFLREAVKLQKQTMYAWISYLAHTMKEFSLKQVAGKLSALHIRQFFISGDEDHCFLKGIRELHEKLSDSTMYVIEKCGHICSIEKWEEFNRKVMGFIGNTRLLTTK